MEIKLDEIVTILKLILNSDVYAIPFWATIAVTLFYVFIKKMLEPSANQNLKKGVLNKLISFFTLPKMNITFTTIATLSLLLSIIYLYYGKNKITNLQNLGLKIKTYSVSENTYQFDTNKLSYLLDIKPNMLEKVHEQFPSEFLIVNDTILKTKKPFKKFIVTDGEKRNIINEKSKKILISFFKDSLNLKTNDIISFDTLQAKNSFFSNEIIYSFLIESEEFCYTKHKTLNCIKKIKKTSKPKRE